jgi:uncharacterized glyoxalase superfamily protein PhnB
MPAPPQGFSNLFPCLAYDDAAKAIDWLCRAFGFEKRLVVHGENGGVRHSELSCGTGVIMVGSSQPDRQFVSPRRTKAGTQSICMRVDDPDAHCARARAEGAEILQEPKDEHYGARGYEARDLEGHRWYFGNYQPGSWWDGATLDPK